MDNKIIQALERLEHISASCIVNWKQGNDAGYYEDFIRTLGHLEFIVDFHFNSLMERKEGLLSIIKELYQYVWNKDMIGIVDVLEYELIPFIYEWRQSYEMTRQTAPKEG
ncbi:hypothetical protein [Bacillus alveayuensis]|uniref:hypothetical protein n=1 Tax=Aeribacillus alveayuensis TaxID=279215 RepID=UPI0005CD1802|nr:hypothetical protein [Bacillus alveayuensis]